MVFCILEATKINLLMLVQLNGSAVFGVFDITKTSARVVVTFDNDGGGNIIKNGVFKTLSD